jgi:hypothetical protein
MCKMIFLHISWSVVSVPFSFLHCLAHERGLGNVNKLTGIGFSDLQPAGLG